MTGELAVALLWHLHQPEYRDLVTGRPALPWVRLHGASSYGHMATVLSELPAARVTLNVVPCLVDQLQAWADGGVADDWARLAEAERWDAAERAFLRRHFFSTDVDTTSERWPAFGQLYAAREDAGRWDEHDHRVLVGLFELSWIDPRRLAAEPALAELADSLGPFTPDRLREIHAFQRQLAAEVLPTWQRLASSGQVELSTTPYYHPILPLLVDPASAREALPDLILPSGLAPHPDDAERQLAQALARHTEAFGRPPSGLWPSEGAVGQAVLERLPSALGWLASDQAQLYASLGVADQADARLYEPWQVTAGGRDLALFFRDRELSDRIGFRYAHMPAGEAVDDFVGYLERLRTTLVEGPHVVTVALDGENPWAAYGDGGDAFLRALYLRLTTTPGLCMTTFSDYLAEHPPSRRIERLATGSWIRGDLSTWVGDAAQSEAWDRLAQARQDLTAALAEPSWASTAWRSLWAAEGSDWYWWYGHRHSSNEDRAFDRTFRRHLANTYLARGAPVPPTMDLPIVAEVGSGGAMARGA